MKKKKKKTQILQYSLLTKHRQSSIDHSLYNDINIGINWAILNYIFFLSGDNKLIDHHIVHHYVSK